MTTKTDLPEHCPICGADNDTILSDLDNPGGWYCGECETCWDAEFQACAEAAQRVGKLLEAASELEEEFDDRPPVVYRLTSALYEGAHRGTTASALLYQLSQGNTAREALVELGLADG